MDNGERPAFPIKCNNIVYAGITKREHFAGLAMQGLLANPEFREWDSIRIVKESIVTADELLKQLDNG